MIHGIFVNKCKLDRIYIIPIIIHFQRQIRNLHISIVFNSVTDAQLTIGIHII